jgi:glycine C-acetyltransferase
VSVRERLAADLAELRAGGLYKSERVLTTPQGAVVRVADGAEVLNFCANNYLGLANHPEVVAAARQALDDHGFGMASVRFICGTQDLHKQLEASIASFFEKDDAILYSSCFDANGGLFETLLGPDDAVISDALNHASIIDGVRLCKAARLRYAHADMDDLERRLVESKEARTRLIATDGVFSMDGDLAPLDEIVALARRHDALVMVDDSHATGFIGPQGKGSAEAKGVHDQVDIFTSTLGKALGGGSGGFTTASAEVVALLRQRSRPYLFSNTLPPPLAAAGIRVFELLTNSAALRSRLAQSTQHFRAEMTGAGFDVRPGEHPIVPVMLYDAKLAQGMAAELLGLGIYVIGFSYPVVPRGQARIRVQISAVHERRHLDRAVEAFVDVGKRLGVLNR